MTQKVKPTTTEPPKVTATARPQSQVSKSPASQAATAATGMTPTVISAITMRIEDFIHLVETTTNSQEVALRLSSLRDALIELYPKGFHPAFHEMNRWVNELRKKDELTADMKRDLLEKLYDWKERLTTV